MKSKTKSKPKPKKPKPKPLGYIKWKWMRGVDHKKCAEEIATIYNRKRLTLDSKRREIVCMGIVCSFFYFTLYIVCGYLQANDCTLSN